MRLEIPIKEVQEFLRNYYNIKVSLKNIEENKIKATYIDSVVLILKEVREDVVLIYYEADRLVNLIAKAAHFFLKKKLENMPIKWDTRKREVTIDLKRIQEISAFLKFLYVSELHFVNENILFVLYARDKT
jgi:uncharacterized protein YijF (DUF1287 family)